jgi:hypothetical protein
MAALPSKLFLLLAITTPPLASVLQDRLEIAAVLTISVRESYSGL